MCVWSKIIWFLVKRALHWSSCQKTGLFFSLSLLLIRWFRKAVGAEKGWVVWGLYWEFLGFLIRESDTGLPFPLLKLWLLLVHIKGGREDSPFLRDFCFREKTIHAEEFQRELKAYWFKGWLIINVRGRGTAEVEGAEQGGTWLRTWCWAVGLGANTINLHPCWFATTLKEN